MPIRPFITAGVALASAGAIVAATPAVLPAQQTMVTANVPTALAKKSLTVNQVKLLSLSDITVQAILDAYVYGWGGGVLDDDPYYPVDPDDYPIQVPGTAGVAYYVGDQALESLKDAGIPLVSSLADFVYWNVTSYFYEIGPSAALHVALAEATGGPSTDFAAFLQLLFNPGGLGGVFASSAAPAGAAAPFALSDITFQDIVNAYQGGYGPFLTDTDLYYPTDDPQLVTGIRGVAYYVGDEALWSLKEADLPVVSSLADFVFQNVTTYFYEVGPSAALHVALAEATGGPETPFAHLLKLVFNPGGSATTSGAVERAAVSGQLAGPRLDAKESALDAGGATAGNGPEVLPKKTDLLNVSVADLAGAKAVKDSEPTGTGDAEQAEDIKDTKDTQDTKPVNIKKAPKFGVKKANPLADLSEKVGDFKDNVEKTRKNIKESLAKLTGADKQDKDVPGSTEPGPESGDASGSGSGSGE